MKYLYRILWVCCVLCSIEAKAQFEEFFFYDEDLKGYRQPNRVGLIVGQAINTKTASHGYDSRYHGLHIAFQQEWYHNRNITSMFDIGFIQKGFTNTLILHPDEDEKELSPTVNDYESEVEYLSFSCLVKYKGHLGNFSPYLFAGTRIDLLLNDSSDFGYRNIQVDYNGIVPGFYYGIGLNYTMKRDKYSVGIMLAQHFDFIDAMDLNSTDPDEVDLEALSFRNFTYMVNLVLSYEITWKKIVIFR